MSRRTPHNSPPADVAVILVSALQRSAFWGSVLLPLVYLPLLSTPFVFSGSLADSELFAIGGLIVLNVVCLLFGHEYSP